ncbi:MAG: helix-turn-helix domain-containing protein [Roseitalea sp.]|nr:helix-turn-helix domain-containing protein [Roseitalea sp.]MBO6951020.1 helix-turn-helix domain-containing protein [Rhizobiaceae bacterium]MBO6590993.1 helix-turn-helix domain-containing protein [Roseitalea sp.]MBO6599749.1 helix-turn-helix domain-containing protein [Roseitalea sp.]MBO6611505.1 helix-turn-helix domain-containing protein [Roseitalea sp.]
MIFKTKVSILENSSFSQRLHHLKGEMTVREFAEKTGVPYGTLASMMKGHVPGSDKVVQIAKAMSVSTDYLLLGDEKSSNSSELAYVPVYDVRASAGVGEMVLDEDFLGGRMPFNVAWLRSLGISHVNNVAMVEAQGDSMEKGHKDGIRDGDMLLVDTAVNDVNDGGIYVLDLNGKLLVKRIQLLVDGGINIISDNPAYPDQKVDRDETQFVRVLGRVFWHGRHLL